MLVKITVIDTNRLRQLVRDHGREWHLKSKIRNMPCFQGRRGVAIQSLDKQHERNIEVDKVEIMV